MGSTEAEEALVAERRRVRKRPGCLLCRGVATVS